MSQSNPMHTWAEMLAILTPGEAEVLQLFVQTHCYKQVARARRTRPRTVNGQLETIMQKLGYSSRSDLLALAIVAWQAQNNSSA
jgi:DNA-binding CsgD family transcriptional regulator